MKRVLFLACAAAVASASQAAVIIDDFTSGNFLMSGKTAQYATQSGSTPQIIQAFRYESHTFDASSANRAMVSEADGTGNYYFEAGSGVVGKLVIAWLNGLQTGVGGSGAGGLTLGDVKSFNPTINISNQTHLVLDYINNDQNTMVAFGIYGDNFSTTEEHSLSLAQGAGTLNMALSNFTGTDLTKVGGLYLRFEVPNGNDFTLTKYSMVPEPGAMLVLGAGISALVARRRRK